MLKSRGRHARKSPRRRPRLPLWAGALLLAYDGMREMNAATASQLAESAQAGAM